MRAYSMDLRQKIVSAYEGGHGTLDEVAETFEVGRRTVARFVGLARVGAGLWPKPHGGGCPLSLGDDALTLLRERVALRPDATLSELSDYLRTRARVRVHPATVCRALQRLGLPRKKKPGGRRARRAAARRVPPGGGSLARRRLVFTDETGFNLAMTRRFGRAPRGQRVRQRAPRKRGTHVTLIGALALRGWVAALSFRNLSDESVTAVAPYARHEHYIQRGR